MNTVLLKRVESLEIWKLVGEKAQHFAFRVSDRRARIVDTLAQAESLLSVALNQARIARAH